MKIAKSLPRAVSVCVILMALCITGCKKDPAAPRLPGSVTVSKVKTEITTSVSGAADTIYYAYDSSGRQARSQMDTMVTTYSYSAGAVSQVITLAGEIFPTSYTLNAAGLAASDSKGNIYRYDSAGYLISEVYTASGNYDSTTYLLSGGDIDSSVERQGDASTADLILTAYTYLAVPDSRNYSLSFLGKQNTNLINSQTITQTLNGQIYTSVYTYSYTFDPLGRVLQQVRSSGTASYTTSYTYY
jgi:hypothetical protein